MICVYCCAKDSLIEIKGWKDIGDGSLVCRDCYDKKLERNKRQNRGKKKYRKRVKDASTS